MRTIYSAAASIAILLAAPAAWAESLPSFTIPTFSLDLVSYSAYPDLESHAAPAAVSLISTSEGATSFSLDSYTQTLRSEANGWNYSRSEVYSTMRLQAADGYRITGITLSATVRGLLERPVLTAPDIIFVDYGDAYNATTAHGGLAPELTWEDSLFAASMVTSPVDLSGTFVNAGNLQAFDFALEIITFARVDPTYYQVSDWTPQNEHITWGDAKLAYTGLVMTVHTEAVSPVPEPGQWAMLLAGVGLIVGARRLIRS